MDFPNILTAIAGFAITLAGFSGVVVAFGSRSEGTWHPGDRLRLGFLMEASLTAGGFSLLALILYSGLENKSFAWAISSGLWSGFMMYSLYSSRQQIQENIEHHNDIDRVANRIVFLIFAALIVLQLANIYFWWAFTPLLTALIFNLVGAAMQFTRLIRSAFNG
ncbi:MAG: hypothetical protein AAF512_13730 [Pseudomonadota bacterium]